MSTENEIWRDASSTNEGNEGSGREGNQSDRDGNQADRNGNLTDRNGNQTEKTGYYNHPYNRDNGNRPYRPRFNSENGERVQRTYSSDRPYRPRFNANGNQGERPQRPYNNDRPRMNGGERTYGSNGERNYGNRSERTYGNQGERTYGAGEGNRPYRPRFNQEGGERTARTSYGNQGEGNRTFRPRFNQEGGERTARTSYGNQGEGNRSFRPRFNPDGNKRPMRPGYGMGNGGERPSYNNNGGERPARPYGNNTGGDRPFRPRFNKNAGDRQGNYGNRADGYNRPTRRPGDYSQRPRYNNKREPVEYKDQFTDPNEPIRLNKFLANAGICSRREADEFITAGVVSVNGEVVTELGTKIKRSDAVKFHDQPVSIERKIYVLLNKPKDTVTTSDDPQGRHTVMDLVKGACQERIYPVGRLDRNTTGVLLLTNDGDLASKLTHPKFLKKKVYHVRLDKDLTKADMDRIATGVQLDDGEIHADAISYTDDLKKDEVGIEIHSGKNRIVRRIFESLGYKVVRLDRVLFAGLTKKGLRRGEWRYLTEQEVNFLRMGSFE
ncbi:MAG: RNA-binding S4 domain-containing protein [Prevotellaceae bacterium]|nr:RNA-binding S4 domain-containing protein [Prevotellaceae bacterium]